MAYHEILKTLPQKYPFLFIDKILEYKAGEKIICLKNVSINEEFFIGHFSHKSIMPGVLIAEAAAQASIILFEKTQLENGYKGEKEYFLSSVKINFIKPVVPGDQLFIEAIPVKLISDAGIFKFNCEVDGEVVAKGELVFAAKEKADDMEIKNG